MAAAVTAGGLQHAGEILKIVLQAPETSTGKNGCFRVGHRGGREGQQPDQQSQQQPFHRCTSSKMALAARSVTPGSPSVDRN